MSEKKQSLPQSLFESTLKHICTNLKLEEIPGVGGSAYMELDSQAPVADGSVGVVRLFQAASIFRVVTCSLVVPEIKLDSHMLFAFTRANSAVPHFTIDSVGAGNHLAFHLDLIPRLDTGSRIAYVNEVYHPLSEAYETAIEIEGLSPAQISPRQRAVMSPWMLAYRATGDAFEQIQFAVDHYVNHWLQTVNTGVSTIALEDVTSAEIISRNHRSKSIIFDPDIDPVWDRITGLIGKSNVESIRKLLIGEDELSSWKKDFRT